MVVSYLQGEVASILALDSSATLGAAQSFVELGLDSLMHMELRNVVNRDFDINVPLADFIGNASISALAELVLKHFALAAGLLARVPPEDDTGEDMEEITL